jgi:23S rRNA (cytidine1920-2'-O)/16S rRNA (cytidine1409-2'-O)-methyltransferase
MTSKRLDQRVVELGLVESREKAQRLILAGSVKVDGELRIKPSLPVSDASRIELLAPPRFVGRGGEKLEAALERFSVDPSGKVCIDVGASTGGFTDCLLQRGARRVYAVDVGRGQLHWNLRNDPRVTVMEGVNARHLEPAAFPERPVLAVADVSFISLTLILPAVTHVVAAPFQIVTLIKPQFEAGRGSVGKGGVVRDPGVHKAVVESLQAFAEKDLGLSCRGVVPSPLKGPAGNVEFLALWERGSSASE